MYGGELGHKHIGILLFPDVEELDAVGPSEVLSFWAQYFPDDGYTVSSCPRPAASSSARKGSSSKRTTPIPTRRRWTYWFTRGGTGTRAQLHDDSHLDWVRHQRTQVPLLTSVCTGALTYAAAGLLAGRPATTHWHELDTLAALDPTIDVRRNERFVDDGDIVTAAGVSAGIDLALHLVARLAGPDRARQVRLGIQYDPPPGQ